jgi:arginyl-tRNA synthetase
MSISDMGDQQKKNAETDFLKASVLMKDAQKLLQAWEAGDNDAVALWKKMNDWVYQGFSETYKALGVDFDKMYYESEIYQHGKDLIFEALKQGRLIKREDGAIIAPLSKIPRKKFADKIVLRADGTSVYITQDIYLAGIKFKEFNLDYSIYCVGGEQDLQMQQVFNTCTIMGFPYGERMYHLSYGMVYLPEGKMKSREGTVVDADDLIESMHELASVGLKSRFPELGSGELEKRAKAIGDAALKYFILQYGRAQAIHFDPKKSIAFEGQTGPYIQYVYARISSILKKVGTTHAKLSGQNITNAEDEWPVLQELIQFPSVVYEAAVQLEPNILAAYLFSLCQTFNVYYHKTSIMKSGEADKPFKLAVLSAVQMVIKNGLKTLGVGVLDEM